jgi:hypothetical protein
MKIQRRRTFKVPTQKCRQARIVLHNFNPSSHISFSHEKNAAQFGIKKERHSFRTAWNHTSQAHEIKNDIMMAWMTPVSLHFTALSWTCPQKNWKQNIESQTARKQHTSSTWKFCIIMLNTNQPLQSHATSIIASIPPIYNEDVNNSAQTKDQYHGIQNLKLSTIMLWMIPQ